MKISVIIPSRLRKETLSKCLKSLQQQVRIPDEIIVVENHHVQTYSDILKQFPRLPIKLILQTKIGKSHARNFGIKNAKYEVLAFLDDDCLPKKNWLSEIENFFNQDISSVVLGKSIEKKKSLLMSAYEFQYKDFFLKSRIDFKTGQVFAGEALNTRNFAIKKALVDKYNLKFDSIFDKFGFAEDADFGKKIESLGEKLKYSEKIVVIHQDEERLGRLLKKKIANGRAMYVFFQKWRMGSSKIPKAKKRFVFERIKKLIEGKGFFSIVLLITYLNLIIFFYRVGYNYQKYFGNFFEKISKDDSISHKKLVQDPLKTITNFGKYKKIIFYLNARTIGLLSISKKYKNAFSSASFFYVDGWGALIYLKMLGINLSHRNTAPDFFDDLCNILEVKKKSVFFLGSRRETIKNFVKKVKKKHPNLLISGFNHGYFSNNKLITNQINQLKPDLLIVGMGSDKLFALPKQEIWCSQHANQLQVKNIWCVGNLFENYISDKIERSTNKNWYFEWLSRIIENPKKMLIRSFLDLGIYIYAISLQAFRNIFK